jgi:hypothetical protein
MTTLELANDGSDLVPNADQRAGSDDQQTIRARRARLAGRVSLAVPVLAAAAGALLLSRGRKRRGVGFGALGAALGLGFARWQLQRFVTESGPYEVEARLGDIELRGYPEQVLAETVVEQASWNDALSDGFKRLAGYIFGDNDATERLSMTAPVLSTLPPAEHRGERLSMTAPVLATVGAANEVTSRTVAFVMPGDRTLADLPKPRDPRIQLRVVPARLVAALVFRGNYKSGLPAAKREELLEKLHAAGMASKGEATFAGYDPPSTIPALRRNEVLVELADP